MNEESRPDQWVTIAEAARTLGLPKGYVRRMALRLSDADRTLSSDGWTRVRLEALQELNATAENDPQAAFQALYGREGANTAALITHLQEEIAFLWGELERRNQAEAELRQLMLLDRRELMELRQRIAHLEAGPEGAVAHSEPVTETGTAVDHAASQAPGAETPVVYGYEERLEAEELVETASIAQDTILASREAQPAYEAPAATVPAATVPAKPESVAPDLVAEETQPTIKEPRVAAPVAASPVLSPAESDAMVSAALRDLDEAIRSITEGLPEISDPGAPPANRFVPPASRPYAVAPAATPPADTTPPVSRNEPRAAEPLASNAAPPPAMDRTADYRPIAPPSATGSPVDRTDSARTPPPPTSRLTDALSDRGRSSFMESDLSRPASNSTRLAPLDHEMSDILIPPDSQTARAMPPVDTAAAKAEIQPLTPEAFEDEEPEYRNGLHPSTADVPRADATRLPRIPINVETGLDRASAGIDYVGLAALLQEHRNKVRPAEPEPEPEQPAVPERPVIRLDGAMPSSSATGQRGYSDVRHIPNSPSHTSAGETDAFLSIDEEEEEESDPISRLRGRDTRRAAPASTPTPPSPTSPSGTARQQPPSTGTDEPGKRISGMHPFFSPEADEESDAPPAGAQGGRKWWQFWKR